MRRSAADWIGELWAKFGLGRPSGDPVERLQVDGVEVRLRPSDSGNAVIVEADGGPVPTDGPDRVRMVARVLELNLGLLTGNVAAGVLADTAPGLKVVRYTAAWPLGRDGLDGLVAAVDDVIHRAELHRAEFSEVRRPQPRAVRQTEAEFDPRFIFRP